MHPEIESTIRESARQYLASFAQTKDNQYVKAAEAGHITFDDIYFLGIVNGAGSVALKLLVDNEFAPLREPKPNEQLPTIVIQDDPDFRSRESELQYKFVAELYNCTPVEAESRSDGIQAKAAKHHNDSISGRKY